MEEFEDGLEGCGNGIGFRCWEAGDPGAGSGPSGFAFDASVHIGAYGSCYVYDSVHSISLVPMSLVINCLVFVGGKKSPPGAAASREGVRWRSFAGAYGLLVLPEIPLDAGGRRRLCGDPLRSSHRREDDIRRFAFHAVCVFSLDRIPLQI